MSQQPDKTTTFYACTCGSETLTLEKWNDEDEIYLSMWYRGYYHPMGWRQRIRYCWQIIRKGIPYGDQVVLDKATAMQLGDKLIELTISK